MNLFKILFVVGLMFVISDAFGQSSSGVVDDPDVTVVSWEPPTTRQNGDALDPETELAEYRLYCGDVVTPLQVGPETSQELPKSQILPGYGEHQCSITAVDTEGRESPRSEPVTVGWDMSPPSAPRRFLVITDT